jgi:hypothetical protein
MELRPSSQLLMTEQQNSELGVRIGSFAAQSISTGQALFAFSFVNKHNKREKKNS